MILCVALTRILMFEVSISLQTSYIGKFWNWWILTGQAKITKILVADFILCLDLLATCQVDDIILCFNKSVCRRTQSCVLLWLILMWMQSVNVATRTPCMIIIVHAGLANYRYCMFYVG